MLSRLAHAPVRHVHAARGILNIPQDIQRLPAALFGGRGQREAEPPNIADHLRERLLIFTEFAPQVLERGDQPVPPQHRV